MRKNTYISCVGPVAGGSHVALGRQLEEFGHIEKHAENDHGHDIMKNAFPLFPRDDDGMVIDGLGDGTVPLHGQGHRHVDGENQHNVMERVEGVGEHQGMDVGFVHFGADAFQEGKQKIHIVGDG